ncbi:MAG TPA: hypothetical protein PKE47_05850, partial [Verrucomicrobiota bacterium]|nr:hypothetical protein [Verrucomicrobiota bacterium]
SVAGVVAPLMAGWLFGYFVRPEAVGVLPGAPFFLGTLFILAALGVAWVTLKRHRSPDTRTAGENNRVAER